MGRSNIYSWLKLHSDARTDEKLATLDFAEHYVWFNLLCLANEGDPRGTISGDRGSDAALLALAVARGDEALLERTLAHLLRLRIITEVRDHDDDGRLVGYAFIHWGERQDMAPSARPEALRERQARFRARHRQERTDVTNVTTSDDGVTNVTAYAPSPVVTTPVVTVTSSAVTVPADVTTPVVTVTTEEKNRIENLDPNTRGSIDLDHPAPARARMDRSRLAATGPPQQMNITANRLAWWNAYLDKHAADLGIPPDNRIRTLEWMEEVRDNFLADARAKGHTSPDWVSALEKWFQGELKYFRRDVENGRAGLLLGGAAPRVSAASVPRNGHGPPGANGGQALSDAARQALERGQVERAVRSWAGELHADSAAQQRAVAVLLDRLAGPQPPAGGALTLLTRGREIIKAFGVRSLDDLLATLAPPVEGDP